MMKKITTLFFTLVTVVAVFAQQQKGTMVINGVETEYKIEKQYRIGPGAVYTKYRMENIEPYKYKMVVNVIEIDQTDPYARQAPYLANGKYFSYNSQVDEYGRLKTLGKKPIASVMANGFTQSTTGNAKNPDWSISGGFVSDGAVCHIPSGANFYVDGDKKAHVGNLKMSVSVTSASAGAISIGNINRIRSNSSLPTLFCNGYEKSRDVDTGVGAEVVVQLIGASVIGTGETEAVVVSKKTGTNNSFSDGYAIISGRSGDALNYVNSLNVGDNVTISVKCTDAQNSVVDLKQSAAPLFGYGVKEGVAQSSNEAGYAQCAMGASADGNTSYWIEMDNVTGVSDAPVYVLNQFMQQLGIYNALLMDGGPSAEMQIAGEWVSVNSMGGGLNGRAIPGAVMLYSDAPDDDKLAEVVPVEKEVFLNIGVPYTPTYYSYNQYGDMISIGSSDRNSYYLEFDGDWGKVSADGKSFTATGIGEGDVYACVIGSDKKSSFHVIVTDVSSVQIEPKNFYTEEGRGCQATLYLVYNDGTRKVLDNADVQWETSDRWVASCDEGYISPMQDGETEITATYNGMSDVCNVNVETVTGMIDLTPLNLDVRNFDIVLAGAPRYVQVDVVSQVTGYMYLYYKDGSGKSYSSSIARVEGGKTVEAKYTFDYDKLSTYPIELNRLTIAGGYSFNLNSLKVYYGNSTEIAAVDQELPVSVAGMPDNSLKVTLPNTVNNALCSVYSLDGKVISEGSVVGGENIVALNSATNSNVVIVCVTYNGKKYIFKIKTF